MNIADLPILDAATAPATPFPLFELWLREAQVAAVPEPTAMTLATANADGSPSARMVLLRRYDGRGFCFFTNYTSRKAKELGDNPRAALVFFWPVFQRQIRIEGGGEKTSAAESDEYFSTRPRGNRLSAWASPQSQVLSGRAILEKQMAEMELRFEGKDVPRPEYWGGYRVVPDVIEFWQGGECRLHDRLRYRRQEDGTWVVERLAP